MYMQQYYGVLGAEILLCTDDLSKALVVFAGGGSACAPACAFVRVRVFLYKREAMLTIFFC